MNVTAPPINLLNWLRVLFCPHNTGEGFRIVMEDHTHVEVTLWQCSRCKHLWFEKSGP